MSIIGSIVVGGVAGALGKFVMPGKDPGGIIVTIALGVVGGILAGYLGGMMGLSTEGSLVKEIVSAAVGAIILLFLYRLYLKSRGGA